MNTKNVAIAVVAIVVVVAVAGAAYWLMNDDDEGSTTDDSFVPYEMLSEGTFEYNAHGFVNEDLTEYHYATMNINLSQDSISFDNISKYELTPEDTTSEGWTNLVQEAQNREYDTTESRMPGVGIEEIQDRMIRSFGFLDGWTAIPTSVEYELTMPIDGVYFHEFTGYKFLKGADVIYVATNGLVLEAYLYDSDVPGNDLDFLLSGAERISEYGPSVY